jgi:hypothetical protein
MLDLAVDLAEPIKQHGIAPVVEAVAKQSSEAITKCSVAGTTAYIVTDPKTAKKAMSQRPHIFSRIDVLQAASGSSGSTPLPPGLFTAEGDQWKRYRSVLSRQNPITSVYIVLAQNIDSSCLFQETSYSYDPVCGFNSREAGGQSTAKCPEWWQRKVGCD